ncbi:hypothetical protein [Streptomyces sp. enrichment culture]|uniref:hypothetical protein n=1 Tax=Streptomyces sp. enrichment culture TaxID=1795815 RepID=UPI003F5428C9
MISPGEIPQFTGDFDELGKDVSALRSDAIGIRNGGADVHSRFQMLGAFYTAPEADALFATTQPVMDKADVFAAKLETVADALDTFSIEARPLAERLKQLKADAVAFTDSVEGDDDWTEDDKKVDRNKQLIDDVSTTQFAFQDAERRAASRISAVVGGPVFVADDGSGLVERGTVTYGYDAALFEDAKELPWGSVDDRTYEAWSLDWFGHGAKSVFWDGIYKDGIEAAAKGLWALGTGDGEAWRGLKEVVTGIGLYTMTPYDAFMDWAVGPDKESEDEVRAKKAAKEFAKGIVAWDQWEENPARATGTVIFNVLTLGAGPLAAASKAGKGGLASNAAGAASKAGLYMDPLYVGLKATGAAAGKLPKLSDLTSRITVGAGAAADAQRVHSVIELEDGSRVVIGNGEFIAYNRHGDAVSDVPARERSDTPDTVSVTPDRELTAVAAHSRGSDASGRVGDGIPTGTGRDAPSGNSGDTAARAGVGQAPHSSGAVHAGRSEGPGSSSGANGSGQGGAEAGRQGSGHLDDLGRTGDDGPGNEPGEAAPGQAGEAQRPSFMREGSNPYGPRGSLTREQIEEIQVYRANQEPGYFERYYKDNGWRKRLNLRDESGLTPPQLALGSESASWIRAKDTPEAPEPYFLDDDYVRVGADTVTSKARLRILDVAADRRHFAVQWDNTVKRWKEEAVLVDDIHRTADSAAERVESGATYKESHTAMGDAAEEFGEKAAEYHYIAERHPNHEKQSLLGPKNGNDQFDQVWLREDGHAVVVEAKSNTLTELGTRTLPNGKKVAQGSREYFFDILRFMNKRGEVELVRTLRRALTDGKLEYVVVKGERNSGTYTGYQYRRFDITRGTLP